MYTIQNIANIISNQSTRLIASNCPIKHLLFDSRQLVFPSTTLFFAIKGERNDGHKYIKSLYDAGVRNFVVSEINTEEFEEANFIIVENTLVALQELTAYHKSQFPSLKTIGITGSNGKTIIKEWLFQLLHEDHSVVRSPRSYNSQIGVPMSVWPINQGHEIGIFEAGISKVNEMEILADIIQPNIAIFTNIGTAHSEGFQSEKEKIKEKAKLFKSCQTIIYCRDYNGIHQHIKSAFPNKDNFTWSRTQEADLQIDTISNQKENSIIDAIFKGKKISIRLPYRDDASIENAIHCWALMLHLEYKNSVIQERILELEPVAMRLQLKEGIHNCMLINDSYNSDINALRIALQFMHLHSPHKKKTLILSDILQSGLSKEDLYQEVATTIIQNKINRFIGIGNEIAALAEILPDELQTHFYVDTPSFLSWISDLDFEKETILIKGARKFTFEKIANRLAQKVHQTVLEVNLSAVIDNLKVYNRFLNPETKVLAMVKAAGYGSGSLEIARLLESQQIDYLGVAYADEGIELRKAGITLPILVLNSEKAVFEQMIAHQLEPEIYSFHQLKQFLEIRINNEAPYPIHINLDTGMNRQGFEEAHFGELIQILQNNNHKIYIKSIFSHLAASDASIEDNFTHQQVNLFEQYYTQLSTALGYQPTKHILNSSGISRFSQYQMDMVRLGIGLYGIDASEGVQKELQVVNTLKATISQIKSIHPNETIGYNRNGKLPKGGKIATISIGYADGLLRQAGNGRYEVLVHGQKAPTVGNICMDMCMIDISHIPNAQEGDEVEIFGAILPVQALARSLQTIPYEIFTNISTRVKRVYYQE